jgi:hypothetical protein
MEHVNHPSHYNQHPAGIECIDIIRHYTCDIANAIKYLWRAGLKPEMGKEDAEKEIEDLKKALWYIEDYRVKIPKLLLSHFKTRARMMQIVIEVTGHAVDEIAYCGYVDFVADAIGHLLCVGIIRQGEVRVCERWEEDIRIATKAIHQRILDIEHSLLDKEIKETVDVMHGKAIDGEDYVSKPGCVRETEPEKYDPLNMIVAWGRVYSLTDEVRKKDNGALYSPCENCDLWSECHDWHDMPTPMLEESQCHYLCARIHGATEQQYYREVGMAKYSPRFGTVEVVDELKDATLKLERAKEESND